MSSGIECDDIHFEVMKQAILETLNTTDKSNKNINIEHFKKYYDRNFFCNYLNKFNDNKKLLSQYTEIINEYVKRYGIEKNKNQPLPAYSSLDSTNYSTLLRDVECLKDTTIKEKNDYNKLLLEEDEIDKIKEKEKEIEEETEKIFKPDIKIDIPGIDLDLSEDELDLIVKPPPALVIKTPPPTGEGQQVCNTYYINVESSQFVTPTGDHTVNNNEYSVNITKYTDIVNNIKVYEIELLQCSIPITNYNFSKDLNNNSFQITINNNITCDISLTDGFYLPDDLANELEYQLNQTCYDLYDNDISVNILQQEINSINNLTNSQLICFKVFYNRVTQRFIIGNTYESFNLDPNNSNCLRNLGITDANYNSSQYVNKIVGYLDNKKIWLTPYDNSSNNVHYIEGDNPPKLLGPRCIYMKLSNKQTSLNNPEFNNIKLIKKNYFAKIPITNLPYAEIQDSKNGYLQNKVIIKNEDPITHLYFAFYYYINNDETGPIEFKNNEFNFILKICGN